MSEALALRGLTKRFGDIVAVDGVDLTVPEGSVYGFLGPNGAGKTTTLRILAGLARPSAGEARVFGHEPGSPAALSATGFLPDVPGFYGWMRAEEYLIFVGRLFALDPATVRERAALLLDLAGLSGVDAKIGGYSRGMKQRLGIAQALMNAPRLLMLDEPTSALDPLGRKDVLDMVASLAGRTTVFFSTHILADVERVCERVAILDRGRVVAESGISELKARYAAHRLDVRVTGDPRRLADALSAVGWVTSAAVAEDGSIEVNVSDVEVARREAPGMIAELGYGLESFESGEVSLEDVFVQLVDGAGR